MTTVPEPTQRPRRVAVIGAGMVGLSTAWWLQEHDLEVTVLDRTGVAAGASWGNAGWLTPGLTVPLPSPEVLRYGFRAVVDPASPVYVPLRADLELLRFLFSFARHSTPRSWARAMRAYVPVNRLALGAYDTLLAGGVDAEVLDAAPFLAAFAGEKDRAPLIHELEMIAAAGQRVDHDLLSGEEVRALEPMLTDRTGAAVRLHGQRYIDPPRFVAALADAVQQRGGTIEAPVTVAGIEDDGYDVEVRTSDGQRRRVDAVVVASGAWFGPLVSRFGVRMTVQAGRGYSFSVPVDRLPNGPVYFPVQRVACTPLGDRLRVAGMMEFRRPDAPLDPRRIRAIAEAARPLLRGVDLDDRQDEWVGSRPVTADGLPLIGPTRSPRVLVAGGHGMWGIVLGPLTGQLLARTIVEGQTPAELAPFDPLRR